MPQPALLVPPETLRGLFNAAFADYVAGPFKLGPDNWPVFLGRQGVDLALSRVAHPPGQPSALSGFAFVCPRPELRRWRIGGMGVLPTARGDGSARRMMDDALERARAAGCAAVELEVFVQNERAVAMYARHGFTATHELGGYRLPPGSASGREAHGPVAEPVDEPGLPAALAWLVETSSLMVNLPFQVLPQSLLALPVSLQASRCGSAQLVFSLSPAGVVTIHSLIDRDLRQHDAQVLVQALLARHPGAEMNVPPLQRADVGGHALMASGFEASALRQQHMVMRL